MKSINKIISMVSNRSCEIIRILQSLTGRTQIGRWQVVAAAGPPPWDDRNRMIAKYIPDGSSVIDLGCGAQTLKGYLPANCEYQPCDLVKSSPEVILCNFNDGHYPKVDKAFTHVVCSGVLEYIHDHKRFLKECRSLGGACILSYNIRMPGDSKLARMSNHWINHFSRQELEAEFVAAGFKAVYLEESASGREVIYGITPEAV